MTLTARGCLRQAQQHPTLCWGLTEDMPLVHSCPTLRLRVNSSNPKAASAKTILEKNAKSLNFGCDLLRTQDSTNGEQDFTATV